MPIMEQNIWYQNISWGKGGWGTYFNQSLWHLIQFCHCNGATVIVFARLWHDTWHLGLVLMKYSGEKGTGSNTFMHLNILTVDKQTNMRNILLTSEFGNVICTKVTPIMWRTKSIMLQLISLQSNSICLHLTSQIM